MQLLRIVILVFVLAAMMESLYQAQIQRDPLNVDEIVKQLGVCKANETLNQQFITKLQARIAELEKPKSGAVPKLPESK